MSLLISSCSDDLKYNSQAKGDEITFVLTDIPNTRASNERKGFEPVLMPVSINDTIYFHSAVEENDTEFIGKNIDTRSVPIGSDNSNMIEQIVVDAFMDDESVYFEGEGITYRNNNIWSSDRTYYWPADKDADLSFYAIAGIPSNITEMTDVEFESSNGSEKITGSYTVPKLMKNEGTGTSPKVVYKDAQVQPDLMVAYSKCNYNTVKTSNSGNVPLQMKHLLAAVRFEIGTIEHCKVKEIAIKNLRESGEFTFADQQVVWYLKDDSNEFRQTLDLEIGTATNGGNYPGIDDNDSNISLSGSGENSGVYTFMLLPQNLKDVEFELTIEKTVTVGTGTMKQTEVLTVPAIRSDSKGINEWEAGKIYTYTLSSSSINWTYVFDVTADYIDSDNQQVTGSKSIILPITNHSAKYKVVSYRYLTNRPSVMQPVKWSAKASNSEEGTTTEIADPSYTVSKEPEHWIDSMESSGLGSKNSEPEIYDIDFSPIRLIGTDYQPDTDMRIKTFVGSDDKPIDLSTHRYKTTETMAKTTANCYVVGQAGVYCFPAVYGNSYNKGAINEDAYSWLTDATDGWMNSNPNDFTISKPEIDKIKDAVLVWTDAYELISDDKVYYDSSNNMVVFTINQDYVQQGNALLAVRDEKENILWSWHIWMYEHDIYAPDSYVTLDDGDYWSFGEKVAEGDPDIKYTIMDFTLGRCDKKRVFFASRKGELYFEQEQTNRKITIEVDLLAHTMDYYNINSTVYQWGRKDPFTCFVDSEYTLYKPVYTQYPEYVIPNNLKNEKNGCSYLTSIQNPNIPYRKTGQNEWARNSSIYAWNILKMDERNNGRNSKKSIFDPCPPGYMMPPRGTFRITRDAASDNNMVCGLTEVPIRFFEVLNGPMDFYVNNSDDENHANWTICTSFDFSTYRFYTSEDKISNNDYFEITVTGERKAVGTDIVAPERLYLWTGACDTDNTTNAIAFTIGREKSTKAIYEDMIDEDGKVIQIIVGNEPAYRYSFDPEYASGRVNVRAVRPIKEDRL